MANRIDGIVIPIGGDTSELKQALEAPQKELSNLSKELKDIERGLKFEPGNMELLGQKAEVVQKQIAATTEKLTILKNEQEEFDRKIQTGEITQREYDAFRREIIKTESQLNGLKQEAETLGDSFKRGAEAAGKSIQELGGKIEGAGKKILPFSAAAAGALAGLGGLAYKAGLAADELNTLSAQTGISTEDLQKFQYATDLIDVDMDTLTGSLSKLTKNMATATKGTGDAAAAFDALGITITDSNGELRNNQDVFYETIEALGKLENETQRDAYAMQIFGKSAQDLNPLIKGGADALRELGQEAEDLGLILSQDALDAANEFNDEIDKIKAQAKGTFAVLGTEIGTALLPMLQKLADMAKNVLEWVRGLDEGTIRFIITILAIVAALGPLIIGIGKVTTAIGSIITIVPKLVTAIKGVGTALGALSANPIVLIIAAVVALVAGFIYLWNTSEKFRNFWIGLWNKITSVVTGTVDKFKKLITKTIPDFLKSAIDWVKGLPERLKQIGIDMITGLWEGIKDTFKKLKDGVVNLFKDLTGSIKGLLGIRSPSKVFAGIGGNMAAGLSVGWDKEIKKVQQNLNASAANAFGFTGQGVVNNNRTVSNRQGDYNDHRNVNINMRADQLSDMQRLLDWAKNYQRRERAAMPGTMPRNIGLDRF